MNARTQTWQIAMPPIPERGQQRAALVVCFSSDQSQDIIQATAGYL